MDTSRNTQNELAWAAGFFDGEGSTCILKNSNSMTVKIEQYESSTLERFVKALGVGKVWGPSARGSYSIGYATLASIVVLGKLWPYMSEPKKNQALRVLDQLTVKLDGRVAGPRGRQKKTR